MTIALAVVQRLPTIRTRFMRNHQFPWPMTRWIALGAAMLLSALAAGCGGGGAGAGGAGSTGAGNPAADPASMLVLTSAPSIGSDGRTSATISAIVKDGSNRTMANQQVDFATTDAGSRLQVVSARTDVTGVASATLLISDPENRTIDVSARSGALAGSVKVAVLGTQITLNGPTKFITGASNEFSVTLRDSSGTGIAARPITITSTAGISPSSASVATDSAGQARFRLTALKPGAETLGVSALGAIASSAIEVSAVPAPTAQIIFSAPTAALEVPVNVAQPVSVQFSLFGSAQSNQLITFATTRGELSSTIALTDAAGRASVTLTSQSAGIATITAMADAVIGEQRIEFVGRVPSKMTLQPSPANVPVNPTASGTNASQLIAQVKDVADNPVKGAMVSFSTIADPSNGRIDPAIARTDSYGVATSAFFPGANSTGNSQISVRATVSGSSVTAQTALTASGQALVVRAGSGNTVAVEPEYPSLYVMPWSAIVTDSSGNPVAGANIQASLIGVRFLKGQYFWRNGVWLPGGEDLTLPPFACLSEDSNQNLRLDAGEDRNGNGQLDPANVAVVNLTPSIGQTDAFGAANLQVRYPKNYATWTEIRLRVTVATSSGTEGRSDSVFILPVLSTDVADEFKAPPGKTSPFGLKGDCTNVD